MQEAKHPHYVVKALKRLETGALLISQVSASDEAIERGDGHVFFTHPDGRGFGTASANYAIKNGLVEPIGDGLFGDSQTYRLANV